MRCASPTTGAGSIPRSPRPESPPRASPRCAREPSSAAAACTWSPPRTRHDGRGLAAAPARERAGMSASPIRVLIAEEDDEARDELASLVRSQPSLELADAVSDAAEAILVSMREKPAVAVLDVRIPGGGASAARGIKRCSPQTRVLALSAAGRPRDGARDARGGRRRLSRQGQPGRHPSSRRSSGPRTGRAASRSRSPAA